MKLDGVKGFLEDQEYVSVAYLLGSGAKGGMGALSDVDIGVLLDGELDKQETLDLRLRLINCLSSILKTDNIDVMVMNTASLSLNYNIISEGKVLDSKDERKRVRFETRILSRYLDRRYYHEKHVEGGIKRIAEKGIL